VYVRPLTAIEMRKQILGAVAHVGRYRLVSDLMITAHRINESNQIKSNQITTC
jgi:hypothetical protein